MALPDAGNSISLQQVNVELGNTGTDAINMGGSAVRGLFGIGSGAIDMSDGFGKSSEIGITASAASSANLKTLFDNNTGGSWAADEAKRYTVGASTVMGIVTAPANMGGTLIIDLAGKFQGTSGSSPGGNGGNAMTVSSANITINMASGSFISGGGGGGGNGGTGGGGTSYGCAGSGAGNCGNAGGCAGDENSFYYPISGGAGGAGGVGAGYGVSQANGASGGNGSSGYHHGNNGPSGAGGAGGNGGNFGAAGAAGSNGGGGGGTCATGAGSGSGGGAAGRAITFSGVSAYTIIGTANGTINGAYT